MTNNNAKEVAAVEAKMKEKAAAAAAKKTEPETAGSALKEANERTRRPGNGPRVKPTGQGCPQDFSEEGYASALPSTPAIAKAVWEERA